LPESLTLLILIGAKNSLNIPSKEFATVGSTTFGPRCKNQIFHTWLLTPTATKQLPLDPIGNCNNKTIMVNHPMELWVLVARGPAFPWHALPVWKEFPVVVPFAPVEILHKQQKGRTLLFT
jgi:hypothetical protein